MCKVPDYNFVKFNLLFDITFAVNIVYFKCTKLHLDDYKYVITNICKYNKKIQI